MAFLIALAKQGDPTAYNRIVSRYKGSSGSRPRRTSSPAAIPTI
jgi:hypothetical protein